MAEDKKDQREQSQSREPVQQQRTKTDEIVDAWFGEFAGSRLGNDTETWNLVAQAKEELKRRLAKA